MRATTTRSLIVALAATSFVLTACGSDGGSAAPTTPPDITGPGTTPPGTTPPGTTTPGITGTTTPGTTTPPRGWIGGEPDWSTPEMGAAGGGDAFAEEADSAVRATDMDTDAPAAPAPGETQSLSPLRAGSVDDNATFGDYLAYRQRIAELGIPLRGGDPTGRVVVTVTGADGRPQHGAQVTVTGADGTVVAVVRTTADGTARFLPAMWAQPVDGSWSFTSSGASVTATAGGTADLAVDAAGAGAQPVAVDVLFLLDATGSMGDEIDQLKTSIDSVAERVSALEGIDDLRLAMTVYRDEGDAFVSNTFDFTSDVASFRAALAEVVADGGGDYPEALDEAFHEAVTAPSWREPGTALQLIFLVADAPPHVERQITGYDESIKSAVERGIKVFPVASSESDDQAEAVFRQIAQATGARFVFLSYGAAGAATGPSTDIGTTDYEELALDDLVVRLLAEEVADLTGNDVVPPPTPTSTTNPPQQ